MPGLISKRLMVPFAAAAMLFASWPAAAQNAMTAPSIKKLAGGLPASAILIGNSFFYYNNGLHTMISRLIAAGDPAYKYRSTMVTISGSGVDWHDVESYFRPKAIGNYSFDANNNVVFNDLKKLFDVAIIMDCSQCPIHPKLGSVFDEFVMKNAATIRKNGAEPVLFMSWAYADKPEMTAQLADRYTRAGNQLNALVIPAGLAFARSIALNPQINLYADDKRHPSLAGSYLASATAYAAMFNKSPEGLRWTNGLDVATAAHLQKVAWETVQDYFKP